MQVTPVILGSGRAAQAVAKALACLGVLDPELGLQPAVWLSRQDSLHEVKKKYERPVLCIANPPGLHAQALLQADQAGYAAVLCEKPGCVSLEEVKQLRQIKTPTAILHVYRQMWGPQKLKELVDKNLFGRIITIEGRYWQASTAERALLKLTGEVKPTWKDDPRLSGEYDTYLDTGVHWLDAVSFLFDSTPSQISGWRSFINANSPHRDTHVQLNIRFPNNGRAFGSISKGYHGADNHFEINIVGAKMSASWQFLSPDEIKIGEGRERRSLRRTEMTTGSKQPPFHSVGWLEGYIEIASQVLRSVAKKEQTNYPTLQGHLNLLQAMFATEWDPES